MHTHLRRCHKGQLRVPSNGAPQFKHPHHATSGEPNSHLPPPRAPGPNSPISSSLGTLSSMIKQACSHQPLPMLIKDRVRQHMLIKGRVRQHLLVKGPLCSPHKPQQLLLLVRLPHHPM